MFSAVLRPHDDKYLKYLHTYVLPPPDNEPKVLSLSTIFPQFWGNLHFLPTECRKDLKRIRRRSEIVVISLNNPMTQEWIDLALTLASKSVPIWNVNIGLCFRMFKASSCKIHAWKMRIRSDGRCVSTVMDPFRMDWASPDKETTACSLSSFAHEECIQKTQTCVKAATWWPRVRYRSHTCADVQHGLTQPCWKSWKSFFSGEASTSWRCRMHPGVPRDLLPVCTLLSTTAGGSWTDLRVRRRVPTVSRLLRGQMTFRTLTLVTR